MPKEICLYGDIYGFSAENIINQMNEARNSDVVLRVNGDGGEIRYGFGIITKSKEITGKKLFKNDGVANSMAAFLFCYNDNNEAVDVASFGLHRAGYPAWYEESAELFTDEDKKELTVKNNKLRTALEAKIDVQKFVNITGVTMDMLFAIDQRIEVCLTADQALQCGLINRIIQITPEKEAEIKTLAAKFSTRPPIAAKTDPSTLNQTPMTPDKLKAEFPEVYKAIYAKGKARGIELEYARVDAILAFAETDPKKVVEAFKTKQPLSASQQTEFLRKDFAIIAAKKIEDESPEAITTAAETALEKKPVGAAAIEAKQTKEFNDLLDKHIKKIK